MPLDYKWALTQIKSGKSVEQVEQAAEQCIAEANQELLHKQIMTFLVSGRSFVSCARHLSDEQIRRVIKGVGESFVIHVRQYEETH
jgi:hypothetical protein